MRKGQENLWCLDFLLGRGRRGPSNLPWGLCFGPQISHCPPIRVASEWPVPESRTWKGLCCPVGGKKYTTGWEGVCVHVHMCKKGFLSVRSVCVFVCVHGHVCKKGFLSQLGKRLLAPLPTHAGLPLSALTVHPALLLPRRSGPCVSRWCPWPGVRGGRRVKWCHSPQRSSNSGPRV